MIPSPGACNKCTHTFKGDCRLRGRICRMHIYQNNMRNKWKIVMDARIENIRQSLIRNYMVTTPYIVFHHLSIYFSSFVIKWYTACNESEKKNRACDHSVPVRIPLYRDLFFVSVAASCRHIWSQHTCNITDRHSLEPHMSRTRHDGVPDPSCSSAPARIRSPYCSWQSLQPDVPYR